VYLTKERTSTQF